MKHKIILNMIKSGNVKINDVVQFHNDSVKVCCSFNPSEKVLNVHIGFNLHNEVELPAHIARAITESIQIKQRYFPQ